ncbi:MAG: lysine--tRNA ligase [Candidatus Delongbacteria bacterium]|nr:lysine--tRNA ligase [Candidatus Delongbacteria bacterium]MCG2760110.1 lysine--tRNA ligase [Candidatus Delongbacteria bacterium]
MEDLGKLINTRIEKINAIREMGINPFPYNYAITDFSADIKDNFDSYNKDNEEFKPVTVAGRIMSVRLMGKAAFCTIHDKKGNIQLYVAQKNIGDKYYDLFKILDIGDIIGVKGIVKKTQVGEITVYIDSLTLLTKNIRPLPIVKEKDGEVYDAFHDKELRYRNRHLDLIVTHGVKELFEKRTRIIKIVKRILDIKGFLEVETPILLPIYGGANAGPFTTYHNTLDMLLYLRISIEPYLKRLIVGGIDRVYEIGKCFRNEGMDRTHNPEFTMLELYQSYADYNDMMDLTEELFEDTCKELYGKTEIEFDGKTISLKRPWRRLKMIDAIREYADIDIESLSDDELKNIIKKHGGELKSAFVRGLAINEIFELLVEQHLIQPVFITHQPLETTPLCKVDYEDERYLQRFELFINGSEFANAYSESNDPVFQRKTLYDQSLRKEADTEASPMDENFVQAIETGMPPTGGLGVGIDRMVMLLTGERSIRDVLLFPTMKPEK